jgi:PilZ domain
MSTGRSERRIAKAVSVEVWLQDVPSSRKSTLTENVSAHGARVRMEQSLKPGQRVLVDSAREGVRSEARIVYCQRVASREFVVGLELSKRVEQWARPY